MKILKVNFINPTDIGATINGVTAAVPGQNGIKTVKMDNETGMVIVEGAKGRSIAVFPSNIKSIEYETPAPAPSAPSAKK